MKKFIYTLAGVIAFAGIYSQKAIAQDTLHIAGADMSYRWISGNKYEVKLNIYTQCPSADPASVWIRVKSPNAGFKETSKLAAVKNLGEIRQDCHPEHNHINSCTDQNSFNKGYKHWEATAEFTLYPYNQCEYIFSWDSCCRLKNITTGGASKHFYTEAYMNICNDLKQRSPEFVPQQFFQVGVNICNAKDFRITDAINSEYSYTYKIIPPKTSSRDTMKYSNGYSFSQPFIIPINDAECNSFEIKPNGYLQFKPFEEDISPVAVELSRYNSTILESRIVKDITFDAVMGMGNENPLVTGVNGTPQKYLRLAAGKTKCFTIYSFDPDGDSVKIFVNGLPAGATITTSENKYPTAIVCWTPNVSHIRKEAYQLVFTAIDDKIGCGDFGQQQGSSTKVIDLFVCTQNDSACLTSSINQNQSISGNMHIWPNPAQNYFYAETEGKSLRNIEMTDMLGKTYSADFHSEGNKIKVNVSGLPKGVYFFKAFSGERIYGAKIMVQ